MRYEDIDQQGTGYATRVFVLINNMLYLILVGVPFSIL